MTKEELALALLKVHRKYGTGSSTHKNLTRTDSLELLMEYVDDSFVTCALEHPDWLIYQDGELRRFSEDKIGTARAIYSDGEYGSRDSVMLLQLEGDHEGPPLMVEVIHARMENDGEEGWDAECDLVRYANTTERIDDIVSDTYMDAIRDEMKEVMTAD